MDCSRFFSVFFINWENIPPTFVLTDLLLAGEGLNHITFLFIKTLLSLLLLF